MKIPYFLRYLTNNLENSKHEPEWDAVFFIVETIALFLGVFAFIHYNEKAWIPVIVIEWCWAIDNLRHNRP